MQFHAFNLHPSLIPAIDAAGYKTPTPIQQQAIPHAIGGKDVMGLAQTGTGKTAAFVLPIISRLLNTNKSAKHVRALVVAPTRELAEQINDTVKAFGQRAGIRSVTIYGGVSMGPQVQGLRSGAQVVVACPGRLLDHMERRTIDLSKVEVLVLDEADHMFDMGFLPGIRRIVKALPRERQTMLFSATMPDDIRKLASETLRNPVTTQVDFAAPARTVSHALYPVAGHLKTALLLELLKANNAGSVLVFTRTKHRAKRVGQMIERAGHRAASIQGNLSQNKRQEALDGFRGGEYRVLVATDIAARGIDVSGVSHVINYDMPDTVDAYTHRIGRTGRAERTGEALTLITREDESSVRGIERVIGKKIERRTIKHFDYTVPAPKADAEFARPPMPPRGRRAPARSHR